MSVLSDILVPFPDLGILYSYLWLIISDEFSGYLVRHYIEEWFWHHFVNFWCMYFEHTNWKFVHMFGEKFNFYVSYDI